LTAGRPRLRGHVGELQGVSRGVFTRSAVVDPWARQPSRVASRDDDLGQQTVNRASRGLSLRLPAPFSAGGGENTPAQGRRRFDRLHCESEGGGSLSEPDEVCSTAIASSGVQGRAEDADICSAQEGREAVDRRRLEEMEAQESYV
jgi:hypothetical protein